MKKKSCFHLFFFFFLQAFRIPLDAVGFYLAAKYTPIRADGETGQPEIAFSDVPVRSIYNSYSCASESLGIVYIIIFSFFHQ